MEDRLLEHETDCPCGSGAHYGHCCAVFHEGKPAPTAETLMRSRYSAYVLGLNEYLQNTWHASTRPNKLILQSDDPIMWTRLEIVRTEKGEPNDKLGIVEFMAHYSVGDKSGYLHETSNFVKEENHWYYFDGEIEYHDDDIQEDFKDFKPIRRRLSVEP